MKNPNNKNEFALERQFVAEFSKLKDWMDDEPSELVQTAMADGSIFDQCETVRRVELKLKKNRGILDSDVSFDMLIQFHNAEFIEAWRDYERRYQGAVESVVLGACFGLSPDEIEAISKSITWEESDKSAENKIHYLSYVFKAARFVAKTKSAEAWDLDDLVQLDDGIAAWDKAESTVFSDLRGIFRRRKLVPQILVSARFANQDDYPLIHNALSNLAECQRAFVFGAFLAAQAMVRSTVEGVIQGGYKATGKDLCEKITSVRNILPPAANADKLHQLRLRGNEILHLNNTRKTLPASRLEMQTYEDILTLRHLIEGVGKRS